MVCYTFTRTKKKHTMSNFVICWSIWIIFWYLCFLFHLISMWRTIKSINWPHKKKDMRLMCAPVSLCLPLKMPTPSRHESQSVTADGIMLRYIRFPAKVWHDYASVYHSCFTSHELCRKAVPLSWKCISSICYRSLHALYDVDMSHTSDSPRKCDMTMLVYIIVVSRF